MKTGWTSSLQLYPCFHQPACGVEPPVGATLFNSQSDDAYLSLGTTLDTASFCSDRGGDFDIYMLTRPAGLSLGEWLMSPAATPSLVDSINSTWDDKCPFVRGRYMVFASEMQGGMGGFDLCYSVFLGSGVPRLIWGPGSTPPQTNTGRCLE